MGMITDRNIYVDTYAPQEGNCYRFHQKTMNRFKILRVIFAVGFFAAILFFFLDFAEIMPLGWHRLAHFQITPAILGGMLGVLGFWLAVTLFAGRIYCSAVCPLGILQDGFSRLGRMALGKKRGAFRFRPARRWLRIGMLAIFIVGLIGMPVLVSLLDPYSVFGRMAASLARPVYVMGNNMLAAWGEGYYVAVHVGTAAVAVSAGMLTLIGGMAFFFGRRYCNTLCPVGTLLGFFAKFSPMKIRLKSTCVSCGLCEKACKGECIDSKYQRVDASRCVACFNCLGTCKREAIGFGLPVIQNITVKTDEENAGEKTRRGFLKFSLLSCFFPALTGCFPASRGTASASPPDPSLPTGVGMVEYELTASVIPPGAGDLIRFRKKCTACHLCVAKCPAGIITPSVGELGKNGFLQPIVRFDHGFCNYDCTICTKVCPSHALKPLEREEKHRTQIGKVVFLKENCVVKTQGTNCGACGEHCPTRAIRMVPFGEPEKNLTIPEMDTELCVGCGACEYICPVRPFRAVYVDGLETHGTAKPAYDPEAKQEAVELEDFGF